MARQWLVVLACAWIMWEELPERTLGDARDPARRWRVVASYLTLKDCEAEIRSLSAEARKGGCKLDSKPVCVPDTVDPRR